MAESPDENGAPVPNGMTGPCAGRRIDPPSKEQVSVDRAIADLRRGAMVMVSGEDGSGLALVSAAELVGPGTVARMVRLAGSAASLAIPRNRAVALNPKAGPARVQSIALPVEMEEERILQLADPTIGLEKAEGPGQTSNGPAHSVVAEPESGPAAGAIRLAKLARLLPAVIVSRIAGVEPAHARRFADEHGLLTVNGVDLARYPVTVARRLVRSAEARVPLADAEQCRFVTFRPLDGGQEHVAIVIGRIDPEAATLIRLHSQCLTGDLMGSLRCDCGDQLRGAIRVMADAGAGVVLYLAQEGRDIGLVNKLRAYTLQDLGVDTVDANEQLGFDADERVYDTAAEMLRQLGIERIRVLTNNPEKLDALTRAGLTVIERVAHAFPDNPHNRAYLETKRERAGHMF